MNSLGYTKDNIHFGDTQIKNGSLSVDGDVFVGGDLEVDGSITGFNISNEVVCLNRWYSTNQTGVFAPALPPATILKNNTSTLSNSGEKTVGNNVIQGDDLEDANSFAVMNLKILNRVENNAGGDNVNQFSIFLTTGGVTSDISWEEMNFGGFTLPFPGAYQNIEKTITFTKSAFNPNNIIVTVNCFKPTNDRSQNVPTTTNTDKFFTSSNFLKLGSQNGNIIAPVSNSTTNNSTFILTGYTPGDDITVDIRVVKTNNAPNVIEANLEYGTLNVYKQQELPSGGGGGGSGNHLALTNLNAIGGSGFADAGHDLMFLSNASKPINGNYFLPTTDGGVAGGVLTTDGAGTTSFQTLTSGVTRAWVNKYSILTNPTFGAGIGIPTNLDTTGSGSKNYTDVNFPIGSQLHIQACGSWNVNTTNLCGGQFVLAVGGGGFTITDVFELIAPVTTLNEVDTGLGYWSVDINIVRVGTTTVRLGRVSVNSRLTSTSTINVPIVNSITNNPNGFTFGVPAFPFDIDLQWIDQSLGGQCFPVAGTYNHNVINANDTLAVTTNPSLDHNTLSNLTTGDPHSQYTKLSGRVGGQVLSGGLLPIHNLVLKSHDIGLPNVTVKDLNTQFNKNIDMDDNEIINCNNIRTNISPIFTINKNGSNATELYGNSTIRRIQVSNRVYLLSGTDLDMGTGDIINSTNTNKIDMDDTNDITLESGSGNIKINSDLNMNSNNTINQDNITFIDNARLDNVNNGFSLRNSRDGPLDNIYIAPGENIFYKNINLQSGANMTFPFANNSIGSPITGNLNNLYVNNINGLTPVGGLYASTSAGTLINNTTLQSLIPLTSVGSLSVPPNGFSVGDCFHLVITGDCVFTNNDTVQITLKQNGNILAQTPSFLLEDANSGNNVFEIEADFNIRSIGAVGSIHTSFEFTYNKDTLDSKDFRGTRSNDTQSINTTIASALDVEFQFISKNASSSIQTQLFRLQKVY